MAGIMVMDELAELQKRVKGMESRGQHAAQDARRRAAQGRQERLPALTGALGALAERMETLATRLTLPKAG